MKRRGAGGMAQWLEALISLTDQEAITPDPGDLMAPSDLHGCLQHIHTSTHRHIHRIRNNLKKQDIKSSCVYVYIS